jgi:hypothetical protein
MAMENYWGKIDGWMRDVRDQCEPYILTICTFSEIIHPCWKHFPVPQRHGIQVCRKFLFNESSETPVYSNYLGVLRNVPFTI